MDAIPVFLILSVFVVGLLAAPASWIMWRGRVRDLQVRLAVLDTRFRNLQADFDTRFRNLQASLDTRYQKLQADLSERAEEPVVAQRAEGALPEQSATVAPEPASTAPEPVPELPVSQPELPTAVSSIPIVALARPDMGRPGVETRRARAQWQPHEPMLAQYIRERVTAALKQGGMEWADWENLVGARWLNKIGIAVLVIGVALFLGYSLQYMGPIGKVATGLVTGLTLLLGGVLLERVEKYRLFANPLIGGGWALVYFTVYAAHNIEAAQIIQNPVLGLSLLGLVATGMILHSLKYRSEVITGLAYALAFFAIAISPVTAFSLVATSVLAASLLAILRKIPWYRLGPLGIAGAYLNHFLWSQSPVGGEVASVVPAQLFWLSQGMLVIYWLLFSGFAFVRKPETDSQEQISLTANVANTLFFLGLSFWQVKGIFPEYLYVLASASAVAYLVSGGLLRVIGRRNHYLVDGSVAVVLLAAIFPLALRTLPISDDWLAMVWLVEAAGVFAVGFRLGEVVFRVESYVLSLAVFGALYAFTLSGAPAGRDLVLGIATAPAIAFFYYLFEQLQRRAGRGDFLSSARKVGIACGYAATAVVATLLWKVLRPELVGLAWLGAGLMLFEAGNRIPRLQLRLQGYLLAALAIGALTLINLYDVYGQPHFDTPSRWLTVSPAILALCYLFWRLLRVATQGTLHKSESEYAHLPSYAATALLTVLLWKQLDPLAVAVAWGIAALLLYEMGTRLNNTTLTIQGHALAGFAFGRLFLANFTAFGDILGVSFRVITVTPILALLYYFGFSVKEDQGRDRAAQFESRLPQYYSYAAAGGLVVLARFEFGRAHTVIAWALLALIFLSLGVLRRDRDFRLQSYLIAAIAFWRSWGTNFYLTGSYFGLPERIATTVPVIASLFAISLLWKSRREALRVPAGVGVIKALAWFDANVRPLFSVLAALLLAALLYYTVEGNLLTIAWAAEGLAILAAGFLVPERSLRLSGLALLGVCLFKVFTIDLEGVETLYRILSFIVLGVILLAVSFGYTKYRHVIQRYL